MADQLVTLADLKSYLDIPSSDTSQDGNLTRQINGVTPVVESITGPIIVREFEEWHDGGQVYIMLRRRPSTALGTSPVLTLVACSEYAGPIEWPLAVISSPDKGQMYSCMLDTNLARVVRRTAGGGVQAFPAMPQAVHVIYAAGQATVPGNVYQGTLELIRVNFETTQAVGRGRRAVADETDTGPPLGFFVPRRVRELLAPTRRHPSIA